MGSGETGELQGIQNQTPVITTGCEVRYGMNHDFAGNMKEGVHKVLICF